MKVDKTYQGHKDKGHWNIALWLFNDYGLYQLVEEVRERFKSRREQARYLMSMLAGEKRPTGSNLPFLVFMQH